MANKLSRKEAQDGVNEAMSATAVLSAILFVTLIGVFIFAVYLD